MPRVTFEPGATTAVLARGLVDRQFARALLRGRPPRLGRAERAAATAVDARRLALFAGFITKVRHSDLFEHVPGTLALLRLHGLEIAAFRDHFLAGDPQRGDAKVAAAIAHFARFARSRRGRAVAGLADVVAHERCQWELRRELARGWTAVDDLTGPVRVARLRHDPYAVIDVTARGERWRGRPRARWWLYWAHAAAGELRVIEIDRDSAAVMRSAPGPRRSAARRAAAVARLIVAGVLRDASTP